MTEDSVHSSVNGNNNYHNNHPSSPSTPVDSFICSTKSDNSHYHQQMNLITTQRDLTFSKTKISLQNNETMSPPCHSLPITSMTIIRPLMEIVDRKILHHGDVLGPIPNLFKWLQSELARIEKNLEGSLMVKSSGNTVVELALTKEEQNLEIVFYNEQYYFEVIRSFRVQQKTNTIDSFNQFDFKTDFSDEKPKAWFCKEMEERISTMRPSQTWLNGKELFCCLMCNHFSFYSNHLMLHIMFDCPKKTSNDNQRNHFSTKMNDEHMIQFNKKTLVNEQEVRNNRKQIRSFDIMSLLNKNDQPEKNENIMIDSDNENEEDDVDVETLDTNEGNFKILNPNLKECHQNKNTKRMDIIRQSIPLHLYHQTTINKQENVRKYNSRKYSNKNNKISSINIISNSNNNNKSAFKKLKHSQNNKKLDSNKSMMNGGSVPSNHFISGLNLTNFYNQLADTSINGTNNPLFPFANLFRTNQNSSITTTQQSSMSSSSSFALNSESNLPFSSIYPFKSNPNNMTNGIDKDKLLSNKLTISPEEPSSSSTSNVNNIGNSLLESNSPTLSESSNSSNSSNSPSYNMETKKEKLLDDSESSMIQLLPQSAQSTMANNPLFNLPPYFMPPTSAAASNPLITSLYLLSPSLTALSYQASNVCAYCNTAFRMTSDLVYHMRSHHKRTRTADDMVNKKRRDDQLRCHICNETFRERHHLTRHMTSHQ